MRALTVLLVLCSGCTLFTSSDAVQCETDADCEDLAETSRCEESVCVPRESPGSTGSTSSVTGATTSTGAGGQSPAACSANSECVERNGGLPFACVEGSCVALLSEDCPTVHGAFQEDGAVYFGVLAQLTGEFLDDGTFASNGVSIAAADFDKVVGVPGGANGTRRAVVFVVCDETDDVERAAAHLIDDVHVPAIIGPKDPDNAVRVATEVTVPKGVLLLTPSESDSLRTLSDDGLVWQQNEPSSNEAFPQAAMANLLAGKIRERYGMVADEPLRLALLVADDEAGAAFAERFVTSVVWNGVSGFDAFAAGQIQQIDYDVDTASDAAAALIEYAPHVVMLATPPSVYDLVLPPLEEGWNAAPQAPPVYMAIEKLVGPNLQESFLGSDLSRNTRLFGTGRGLPLDTSNHQSLTVRYTAKFPGINYVPRSAEDAFDAAYLLAYSAVGAGNVPELDGRAMAAGLTKLLAETPIINVGPADLNTGFASLTAGDINLNGCGTDFAFDPDTGTNHRNFTYTCFANGGEFDSGVDFDSEALELLGTLNCPIDAVE